MIAKETRSLRGRSLSKTRLAIALLATTALGGTVAYAEEITFFLPGNLLLSRSVYNSPASILAVGTTLPPGCTPATAAASGTPCVAAIADGTYPTVFNNDTVDASFGVTAPIFLDEMLTIPSGDVVQTIEVPNSAVKGVMTNTDQMVTSFSSKSEIALNLSLDRNSVSFMGYLAPDSTIDASNSNTPDVPDPTNPVPGTDFRVVASVDQFGQFSFTKTNAYSGNNGRAAVLNNANGANVYYTAGNAGNGSNPQPTGVILGAGAQIMTPSKLALAHQLDPGTPTPVGSFNVTETPLPAGTKPDKAGKDTNFRGLTVFNNVIYMTKGSGSNGINTVYFIDTSGNAANGNPKACPTTGSGVPSPSATLPTTPIVSSETPAQLQSVGVTPVNMCILNGLPTSLAKANSPAPMFPFGVFFANPTTLYVSDEGNGDTTFSGSSFTVAAAQTTAGLQKWVLNATTNTWSLAYTLQAGLALGVPYTVPGYPTGVNAATGLPWSPATDGLRNITGHVNGDGTVTIWAITSTVSGGGDQGADPNKLVTITDKVAATTLPANEKFVTVRTAKFGEVLRGISFTPGTGLGPVQEVSSLLCDLGLCQK
jgi:hypothetical protein